MNRSLIRGSLGVLPDMRPASLSDMASSDGGVRLRRVRFAVAISRPGDAAASLVVSEDRSSRRSVTGATLVTLGLCCLRQVARTVSRVTSGVTVSLPRPVSRRHRPGSSQIVSLYGEPCGGSPCGMVWSSVGQEAEGQWLSSAPIGMIALTQKPSRPRVHWRRRLILGNRVPVAAISAKRV